MSDLETISKIIATDGDDSAGAVRASIRRLALSVLLSAFFLLVGAIPSPGQDDADYPHGDMDRDCSECHTTEGWRPLKDPVDFDHSSTGFPLRLSHDGIPCTSCHEILEFNRVATACADCHFDAHRGELGFGCDNCHIPQTWDNRREMWDRHSATLFPLTGTHASVDCAGCHRPAPPFEFATTPVECFACHAPEYLQTSRPDHQRAGFPVECQLCHTTISWQPARIEGGIDFDHAFFPLNGGHSGLDCSDCHRDGFVGTPTDCYSCHRQDYENTRDPNHVEAGFPTDCEVCHNIRTWDDAEFDHNQIFRLTGAHRSLDCEDCHSDGFQGTPTECYGCHRADYESTDDPDHVRAGFSTDCESCHGTQTWEGAVADHDQFFRLTGAHRSLDCNECHSDGFAGTPTDCWSCHQGDYNNTDDPDHQAAGFPQDCEVCHNTNTWDGADFSQHDSLYFPIFSGQHRNEWSSCSQCHTNPGNFSVFSCFECHSRNEMDDEHDDVGGYEYNSNACYDCHPTGSE